MKNVLKLIFLYGFGLFFILAGANHFLSPDFTFLFLTKSTGSPE
jgi:hypothetical protein